MNIPRWNSDWDPPDPLKGRRGWAAHHYATAGVAALLVVFVLVVVLPFVLLPAMARAQRRETELDRQHNAVQEAIGAAHSFQTK
jgi:hypothetical protein